MTGNLPAPADARLTVAARFNGPPKSANGGYLSGRLAQHVRTGGAVEVTLRRPPPLDTPMDVVHHPAGPADAVRLLRGDELIAEAVPDAVPTDAVQPAGYAEAVEASSRFPGFGVHPFPRCFTCGPLRAAGDGLRLFPGRLDGREDTTACPWTPDASLTSAGSGHVSPEIVWAALDCPGGWTVDMAGRPSVLGRIAVRIDTLPRVGERYVVLGRLLDFEGRKAFTVTSLYDDGGQLLARARQVWVTVDPATVLPS